MLVQGNAQYIRNRYYGPVFNYVHMCMKNASMLCSGIAKIYTFNVMHCRERYELIEDELL